MSPLAGAVGIGLAWGWLAALAVGRSPRRGRAVVALAFSSALVAASAWWLAGDPRAAAALSAASLLSAWAHLTWLRSLARPAHPGEIP